MTSDVAARPDPDPSQVPAPDATDGGLPARVAALEAAQAAHAANARPWYRQASVLIAALALAFSMMATWFGEQRAGERDASAARVELSQLIQRLTSLPKDSAELQAKYAGNTGMLNALSGMVTTESAVLALQASDVIARIPDLVTGAEYFAVGQALVQTGDYGRAETLLDAGLARDNDPSSLAALWRAKAALSFATGEPAEARTAMSKALEAYAAEKPSVAAAADAYTEWEWAGMEKLLGQCEAATAHIQRARARLDALPLTAYRLQMMQSLSDVENQGTPACPSPRAAAGTSPAP